MPITKDVNNTIRYVLKRDNWRFDETGNVAGSQFAVSGDLDVLKQVGIDPNTLPTNTIVTISGNPSTSGNIVVTLPSGSGTLSIVGGAVEQIGPIDSQSKSADGATAIGAFLYMQTADATHPGLAPSIGAANGVASLDSNGLIPLSQIPPAAIERLVIVANQAARFALTTATVQNGDTVRQTDVNEMFFVVDQNNLGNASGYLVYSAGTAASVDWGGITGIPAPVSALLGTNTGDVTLGTQNGLQLSGQVLSLNAADATHPGAITSGTQTIGGSKTFSVQVAAPSILLNSSDTAQSVGTNNIGFGSGNFAGAVTGNNNIALGTNSLASLASGSLNIGIGDLALNILTGGGTNVAVGYGAGAAGIVNHSDNTLVGSLAGYNTNGSGNTGVGASAMFGGSTEAGDHNSAFGASALTALTSGGNNSVIGYNALASVTTGSSNIGIGSGVDVPSASANGQMSIGNFIYGTGLTGTGSTISSGSVGIGVKAPAATLDVLGTGNFSSTLTASNISGTNTGDVTLTAVGSSPSANGASLSGQALTLQPADATHPGVLSAADWNTFNNKQASGSYAVTALSNLATTNINATLKPASDGAIDLGTSTSNWGNLQCYYINATNGSRALDLFSTDGRALVVAATRNLSWGLSSSATAPGIKFDQSTSNGFVKTSAGDGTLAIDTSTYTTAVSVASANGFTGSSSGGATPALTLTTSIAGVLKGNGTAISAATSGTDYSAGTSGLATGILKSTTTTGALTIAVAGDFPTLNQNTSGSAASLSATLAIASGGTGVTSLARVINSQSGTTYTFALVDGKAAGGDPLVLFTSGSAVTATVPTNASIAFPVGTQIDVIQQGAGKVTIAAAGGVTINSKAGNLSISAQYVAATLVQTAANTWTLIGDLIA